MDQSCPIGVIDSGIGGFSVVRRVRQLLPHEDLIYFGDGGNTPYGNHQAGEILRLTRYMLEFMKEKQIKVLLVACNTISCLIDAYRDEMDCPVFSVVQAGAEAVAGLPVKRVGVISTCFTASTRCYPDLITKLSPEKQVFSRGSKYLAGLVEHSMGGEIDWAFIDKELKESLDPLVWEDKVECCLLGCTHYPLVEGRIQSLFPHLPLIDPAQRMAETARDYLREHHLDNPQTDQGKLDIFTTGSAAEYTRKAAKAGLGPVTSVQFYPPMKL